MIERIILILILPLARGSIQVGQKYIVPSPQDLANMPDYLAMVSACGASTSTATCNSAMNQFLSDIHLMVPDTQQYITSLNNQVTTYADMSTTKQGLITALSNTVSTLATQLLGTSDALDAADANYAAALAGLQLTVNNLLNTDQSPIFAVANNQKQVMLDQLTALGTAAAQYLSTQNANIQAVAQYISGLFANDQAIIGNAGAAQLATSTSLASNLTQNIQNVRDWWSANITVEQGNLDGAKAKIVAAKSDADARAAAAQQTIAASVQTGIDTTMATAQAAYLAQVNNVSGVISNLLQSAKSQFDAAYAAASANDSAVTSAIDANITSAQTQLGAIQSLVTVSVQAATVASNEANAALISNQQAKMQTTLAQGTVLNGTIADLTKKISDTSSNVFQASQVFMNNFANLASDASASASGAMVTTATSAGDSMSDLNGYIGGVASAASAASQSSAQSLSGSIDASRNSVAVTNLQQIKALADAINTITTLVALMKSKMGQSSDMSDVQIGSISASIDYSISGLQDSLTAITQAVSTNVASAASTAHDRIVDIAALSANARQTNEALLSATRSSLGAQITQVTTDRIAAGNKAAAVALDGANLANTLGHSNDGLAVQVAALLSQLNTAWTNVQDLVGYLQGNASSSLAALNTTAVTLASNQKTAALAFVNNTATQFSQTIVSAQASALEAQTNAVNTLQSTSSSLLADFNHSASAIAQAVTAATLYANQTLSSLALVPAVLANISAKAQTQLGLMSTSYLAGMAGRINTIENGLLYTIGNQSSNYYAQTNPQIAQLNITIANVTQQLADETAFANNVYATDLFSLSPAEFQAKITAANYQVGNASANQAQRYVWLNANLTQANSLAEQTIDAISANVSQYLPAVTHAVDLAVANATAAVTQASTDFNTYAASLMSNLTAEAATQEAIETNLTNANRAKFDGIIAAGTAASNLIVSNLQNLTAVESNKQAVLANAMDDIIQSMIAVSGNNSAQLRELQSQFTQLQSSTLQMSSQLNASLTSAIGTMSAAAAQAEVNTQTQLLNSQSAASQNVSSLGTRLAYAMDTLSSGNATEIASLSAADGDAVTLAESLGSLGDAAKQKVRDLIGQIMSGQTSLNDVLSAHSDLNLAQIGTAEDLIVAFTSYMQSYLMGLQVGYGNETDKLEAFRSAVPTLLTSFNGTQAAALAEANQLATVANQTVNTYQATVQQVLADSEQVINTSQSELNAMQNSVPDVLAGIKANIRAAVLAVEAGQDTFASNLISSANSTLSTVVTSLRGFRASKNRGDYALTLERVALPTMAPLLSIAQ